MKAIILFLLTLISSTLFATDFGVSSEGHIAQGNDATFTSNITIPVSTTVTESARDAVKLSDGTLLVYNGSAAPMLSIYTNNIWENLSFIGWSTANNVSYGGIASNERFVWVTDMNTGGGIDNNLQGIIQFDLEGQVSDFRFAGDIDPIDLTLGKDGFLYALYPGGSPSGLYIDVFNPVDASYIRTINLADIFGHIAHRSIAVDAQSNVYIADWDGDIQMIDSTNNVVSTINVGSSLYDVDIVDNKIISGDRFGKIYIADLGLHNYQEIELEDLDSSFNGQGVFILGDSVDTSQINIEFLFEDGFE
jgi:hypothetical protein